MDRALNRQGYGEWSSLFDFMTIPSRPEIVILSIPNNEDIKIPTNPVLKWVLDSNIDSYQVQVSRNVDFGELIFSSEKITDSQIQIDGLKAASTYYWKTRGIMHQVLVVGVMEFYY